jgi:phenylalanyl-tRNA synthetase beta chain
VENQEYLKALIQFSLESAYFNPVSIRKTAKRHQLNTDVSFLDLKEELTPA